MHKLLSGSWIMSDKFSSANIIKLIWFKTNSYTIY